MALACSVFRAGRRLVLPFLVSLFAVVLYSSPGQALDDLSSLVNITASNQRSSLDSKTRIMTSSATITITNSSAKTLTTPLHAVVSMSVASGVTMPGASGGPGTSTYGGKYYFDLSSLVVGGVLRPQTSVSFPVTFVRNSTVRFTYTIATYATVQTETGNIPPTARISAPATATIPYGQSSVTVTLDGSGSNDTDGSLVTFTWSGPPQPAPVQKPTITLTPGTYTFSLVVKDDKGADSSPANVTMVVANETVHAPVISLSSPPYSTLAGSSSPLIISVVGSSPDNRSVSLSASPGINNATFSTAAGPNASGTFRFQPDYSQKGKYFITFTARDVYDITTSVSVPIEVSGNNRPPSLSMQESATVPEGSSLSIPLTVSDPDNDTVTLTTSGLFLNGVLIPSTKSLYFAPDFTQSGTYPITITASDGNLSASKTITITVTNVSETQGNALTLLVNPVQSPTFLTSLSLTGTVNSAAPATLKQTSSLITGMHPTTGAQGTTVTVTLTGDTGRFEPHFISGSSQAEFGDGITLQSLSVNGPRQATAVISIAPQAQCGSRPVKITTGSEIALSVLGFSVTQGSTTITGKLLDQDTGQPVSGATAIVNGTSFSAITNTDGIFTISGIPSGPQTLLISAQNYQMVTSLIDPQPNTLLTLPDHYTRATVFLPTAAPSVSLLSLLGRKASDPTGSLSPADARQIVIDTWMLFGGQDAGLLDEYGNQQNPQVTGSGILSLTPNGVKYLAESLSSGKTLSLQEILYALSFGFNWNNGAAPPPLKIWIERFQQLVNSAWADPTNPDNAMAILIFNKGASLSPTPPTINPEMRLNILQANVLVSSFVIYALDPSGNTAQADHKQIHVAFNGNNALLQQLFINAINPSSQGGKSTYRNFWKNYFNTMTNFPLSTLATTVGTAFATMSAIAMGSGSIGATVVSGMAGLVSGIAADIILQYLVALNLQLMVPQPPIPQKTELVTQADNSNRVKVTFNRSVSDSDVIGALSNQSRYWYTLYRYDRLPINTNNGINSFKGEAIANYCSNCLLHDAKTLYDSGVISEHAYQVALADAKKNPLEIIDPNPIPDKVNYYDMSTTRLIGQSTTLQSGDAHLGSTMDWYAGFLPSLNFSLAKGEILGAGILMTVLNPVVSLINGMKQLTSDFSNPVAIYGSAQPVASADEVEIDPSKGFVYHSDVAKQTLFRSEWVQEQFMRTTQMATTGFKGGPVGLAVDSSGNAYTDNQMSDALYGGRIFRFYPNGTRELAGTVNYFSQLLMFARPASVSKMVTGPDDHLYVADEDCGCIKSLAVNLAIDPSRIVGQNYATLSNYAVPVLDLAFGETHNLYVLTASNLQRITPTGAPNSDIYVDLSQALTNRNMNGAGFGGLAVDGFGNVYVSQKGTTATEGTILMFPAETCRANHFCAPITIMDKLDTPGDIELSKDGRSLFVSTAGGNIEKRIFGVSGSVEDFFGTPLGGALITIQTEPRGYSRTIKADAHGKFFFPDVFRADLVTTFLDITVEYDGKTQVYLSRLGQPNLGSYGHTIRNLTFSP